MMLLDRNDDFAPSISVPVDRIDLFILELDAELEPDR